MNVQTERLENHTARLTVELNDKQWEDAKKESARQLSQRYKIPGFRKGKAPYRIIEKYLGEAPIVEDAIERLGNEVYRHALEESEVQPYTAGSLEDFQTEPQPTYIFTVPLQPEVELGDYRATRRDFEAPSVSDEDVDAELRRLQEQEALVEDSHQPIEAGDRVKIDLDSVFADGEEPVEAVDGANDDESEESDPEGSDDVPKKGDQFAHAHDVELSLDPENEPVLPGFIEALVGAEIGDEVEFELTVPDDEEEYEGITGRKVQFNVIINEVSTITLPALNDEFANRIADQFVDAEDGTDEDDEAAPTLTLLELRMKVREQLQTQAETQAEEAYANKVLDDIIDGATVVFPEVMISDRVHEMIRDLDNNLRQQQGIDLETYQKITGTTHEDLHDQYEPDAKRSLTRSLVLGEVMVEEGIRVNNDEVVAEIEQTLAQFGDQADVFRQYFDTPQQRDNIANSLLYRRLMARLRQIGKGEIIDAEADEVDSEAEATVDASDDVNPDTPDDSSTQQSVDTSVTDKQDETNS